MLNKKLLFTSFMMFTLLLVTACEEEETAATDAGTGAGAPVTNESIVGTWAQTDMSMQVSIEVNEQVTYLDGTQEATSTLVLTHLKTEEYNDDNGNGTWDEGEWYHDTNCNDTYDELGTEEVSFSWFNIQERDGQEDCYWGDCWCSEEGDVITEYEIMTESEWIDTDSDSGEWAEIEFRCCNGLTDCHTQIEMDTDSDDCDEGQRDTWVYFHDAPELSWDASTFTLTVGEMSFVEYSSSFTMPAGSISGASNTVLAGNSFVAMQGTDTPEPWETHTITFNADGSLVSQSTVDCAAIPANNDWDCYEDGCAPVYDGTGNNEDPYDNGNVIGCEAFDCTALETDKDCYKEWEICEWNNSTNSCENYHNHDEGPGDNTTWQLSGNVLYVNSPSILSCLSDCSGYDGIDFENSTATEICTFVKTLHDGDDSYGNPNFDDCVSDCDEDVWEELSSGAFWYQDYFFNYCDLCVDYNQETEPTDEWELEDLEDCSEIEPDFGDFMEAIFDSFGHVFNVSLSADGSTALFSNSMPICETLLIALSSLSADEFAALVGDAGEEGLSVSTIDELIAALGMTSFNEFCMEILFDGEVGNDLYGIENEQVEDVTQTQTMNFTKVSSQRSAGWDHGRDHLQQRRNPMVTPKSFKKPGDYR